MDVNFHYTQTAKKKILSINGIKFYTDYTNGLKCFWRCSYKQKSGCRMTVTTIDDEIVKVQGQQKALGVREAAQWMHGRHHGAGRRRAQLHSSTQPLNMELITSQKGKPMLKAGQHRFSRHSSYKEGRPRVLWTCIKWFSGCRASITTYNGTTVLKANENHNHQ
ncbi:FLYWCH zinc finger domain-containing protein [Phthorimaea operculella]|nr:FLYWCH zinc finger domain-containing protein [Phthorimaea operculella]